MLAVYPIYISYSTPRVYRAKPYDTYLFILYIFANTPFLPSVAGLICSFFLAGFFGRRPAAKTVLGPAFGKQHALAKNGASPWTRRCASITVVGAPFRVGTPMLFLHTGQQRRVVCLLCWCW